MLDIIICAATNFLRMYIIYRFVSIFFSKPKVSKKVVVSAYAIFYAVNTSLFLIFHIAWINILCNLICISMIIFLYTNSAKTILFTTCSIYALMMACDIAATMLFVDYQDGEAHSQVCAVIAVFLIFICEILAEKIVQIKRNVEMPYKFPLIFIPMSSILVIWILIYSNTCKDMGIVIVSIGMLIINFLMLYLYNMLLRSITQKYEAELLRQQVQIYSNQLEVIMQGEEKVKALRHDMKHHMNEIKLLANRYDATIIQEYIDHMEDFIQNQDEIVASGNIEIDSVLNYMLRRAQKELKTVKSKIVLPESLKHYFDVNVLIGNLLENAIEAARQTEDQYLYISMVLNKGVLKIKVENSYPGIDRIDMKLEDDKVIWRTTKKEKEKHGIGLKSVKKIVESYEGTMETKIHNNMFCVNLVLYMMQAEDRV